VSVAITAQADVAVYNDGVDTYVLTVTNQGGSRINLITVDLPITAGYTLASASFDRNNTWVSATSADAVTIRVEGMRGAKDTITGTLRFVGPKSSAANALAERVKATWNTGKDTYTAKSNLPLYGAQPLKIDVTTTAGAPYQLSSDIFAIGEPIIFWYTSAAGVSTELMVVNGMLTLQPAKSDIEDTPYCNHAHPNAEGRMAMPMSVAGINAGTYTLVARGDWSGATATATLTVR
jgi:hypothetical protein